MGGGQTFLGTIICQFQTDLDFPVFIAIILPPSPYRYKKAETARHSHLGVGWGGRGKTNAKSKNLHKL